MVDPSSTYLLPSIPKEVAVGDSLPGGKIGSWPRSVATQVVVDLADEVYFYSLTTGGEEPLQHGGVQHIEIVHGK